MYCKKYCFVLLLPLVITNYLFAQEDNTFSTRNIIKVNVSAIIVKNISVQYERKVGDRISIAVNMHTIPYSQLPFYSKVASSVDDPSIRFDLFKLGSFGVTPECRYYVGKKGALHGFYLGPMINITSYKMGVPVNYGDKTGVFNGQVNTVLFGVQLGAQWQLSKNIYLDWWIVGPSYGSSKGNLNFISPLTESEQDDLKFELEDIKNDNDFNHIIKSYSVDGNGANIKAKGPWAGLRAFGINIGFAF